jgi:hypothetical protein
LVLGVIVEEYGSYIVYSMILSPIMAAIFITLIPTVDLSSKNALSRFFALFGFLSFLGVLFLFKDGLLLKQYSYSIKILDFYINFAVFITKYNIFLFGGMAASLLANVVLYELNDTKSNAHQVAPFILTFIIYIMLGQKDLRVALPVISITNFIIYFLIGYSEKAKRGSTIFHMGIFLFSCDALVLILLQYQELEGPTSAAASALNLAVLVSGLARLCLPICAPYMRNLFLNMDEREAPFLISYLHITGFAILIYLRSEIKEVSLLIGSVVAVITLLNAFYLSLAAVNEKDVQIIPYYCLTFYSNIAVIVIFFSDYNSFWYLSSMLLLSNIACFLHCSKIVLVLHQHQHRYSQRAKTKATWFLSLCLNAGIPGFGVGASLWPIIYFLIAANLDSILNPALNIVFFWAILVLISLLLLCFSLILSNKVDHLFNSERNISLFDYRSQINRLFYFSPMIIEIISIAIPWTTFYVSSQVLS